MSTLTTIIELLISVFSLILPKILENNLWDNNVPRTIEKFNEEYEIKIDKILKEKLEDSSSLLDTIVNNKIINNKNLSESKEGSAEYIKILEKHESLLIKLRNYIEIKNNYKLLKNKYSDLHDTIKNIKNFYYICVISLSVLIIIILPNWVDVPVFIVYGVYVLIFYSLFTGIQYYFKYKSIINYIKNYKNKISEAHDNIKKLSDMYGN